MKYKPTDKGYHQTLRSGLRIYPTQDRAINQALVNLMQKIPAHLTLVTDVTGQIVSARGGQEGMDLVALGSLVAGDLAASQEIARLTGQYQEYQMVLREGQNIHTFIIEAGHHLALLVQISKDVPLGWGRMLIQKAAHQLAEIINEVPEDASHNQIIAEEEELLGQKGLSDLFNDALDDLWME